MHHPWQARGLTPSERANLVGDWSVAQKRTDTIAAGIALAIEAGAAESREQVAKEMEAMVGATAGRVHPALTEMWNEMARLMARTIRADLTATGAK